MKQQTGFLILAFWVLNILSVQSFSQSNEVDTSSGNCGGEFFNLEMKCEAGGLLSKGISCSVEFEIPVGECDETISCNIIQNKSQVKALEDFVAYVEEQVEPKELAYRITGMFEKLQLLVNSGECTNFSSEATKLREEFSKLSNRNKKTIDSYIHRKLGWKWFETK